MRKEKTGRRRPLSQSAFTLAEIAVSLAISAIILSTATIYLTGYLPKVELDREAQRLRNFLVLLQTEARDRQENYCVTTKLTSPVTFYVYRDVNSNQVCPEDPGDLLVKTLVLDESISIPSCAVNAYSTGPLRRLFFLGSGRIASIDTGWGGPPIPTMTYKDYEFILSSAKLSAGQKAREVEVLTSTGQVYVTPRGSPGYRPTIASTPFTPAPAVMRQPDMSALTAWTLSWCEE